MGSPQMGKNSVWINREEIRKFEAEQSIGRERERELFEIITSLFGVRMLKVKMYIIIFSSFLIVLKQMI